MDHAAPTASSIPIEAQRKRTLVFVATFCLISNWPDRRLYEPLAADFHVHALLWDRTGLMDEWARERADRYEVAVHEFPGGTWGASSLFRFQRFIVRELDRVHAEHGIHTVVATDPDVLPAIIWHRFARGLRYRIVRNEMDYYAGSRAPGRHLGNWIKRLMLDVLEAILHTQCDLVLTLNRYARERLLRWGVPERKVVVAGLWKPDEYFVGDREPYKRVLLEKRLLTQDQFERIQNRIVISFLGLFYRHTHLRELLDAAKDYPDDFAVILAGKGPDLPVVQEYCGRHRNLVFLGWRNDDELKEFSRITDIVYQPLNPDENANWRYFGSTNKTFEALAAGCLFIGSAINERVDLNAQAQFAAQIDFGKDLATQLHELFRAILADREVLRRRQRNARRLFERYNHAAFVRLIRPLFD